jgi:hypothetical protein
LEWPRGVRVGVGPEGYELEWAPRGTSWSGPPPEGYEFEWLRGVRVGVAPRGSGPEGYELEWPRGESGMPMVNSPQV